MVLFNAFNEKKTFEISENCQLFFEIFRSWKWMKSNEFSILPHNLKSYRVQIESVILKQ